MTPAEEQQLAYVARTNEAVRKVMQEREDLRDANASLRAALSDAITIARSRTGFNHQHRLVELEKLVTAR